MSIVFMLGDVAVPLMGGMEIVQSYEPIGGSSVFRTMNGVAVKQTHWRKVRTNVSANGWIPDGLHALDYDAPLVMKCIGPRGVHSASNEILIPTARRSDAGHIPIGYALVGKNWVLSPATVDEDTATVATVTGASQYRVLYYPEITVFCEPPNQDFDRARATYSWSLDAEEI